MQLNFNYISRYPAPLRLVIFILVLVVFWLPFSAPIYLFSGLDDNSITILTLGVLYIQFIILLQFWGALVHKQPRLIQHYGLFWSQENGLDCLKGVSIGLLFCFGLFATMSVLGWVEIASADGRLFKITAEGLLSATGIGLAEELLFRGWLLDELQRDYSSKTAKWANAVIFALAHFIKPIAEIIRTFVSFFGLVMLGMILVTAKRSHQQRLGICIGLHGGLVWGYYILNVGKLLHYTDRVPTWVTGIDGNPLAGVMGLLFLLILNSLIAKK